MDALHRTKISSHSRHPSVRIWFSRVVMAPSTGLRPRSGQILVSKV